MAETTAVARNDHAADASSADAKVRSKDDPPDHSRNGKHIEVNEAKAESTSVRPKRHRKKPVAEPRTSKDEDATATYAALQRTFAEHLAMVRAEFREAVANYSVRVQGLLTHVDDSVADGQSALTADEREKRARALRDALKEIEALDLKPSKGRRRDLKKVETLAEHLGDVIDEW